MQQSLKHMHNMFKHAVQDDSKVGSGTSLGARDVSKTGSGTSLGARGGAFGHLGDLLGLLAPLFSVLESLLQHLGQHLATMGTLRDPFWNLGGVILGVLVSICV